MKSLRSPTSAMAVMRSSCNMDIAIWETYRLTTAATRHLQTGLPLTEAWCLIGLQSTGTRSSSTFI